ncbi:unnamed protein product [Effrenium voratum]|nr:unnamed protein product [Effrenium voratum]
MASSSGRFTTNSAGTATGFTLPQAVSVEQFAAERAEDVQKLLASLGDVAAQPRHLRRRTRSWQPFGLLRRRTQASAPKTWRKVRRRKVEGQIPASTKLAVEDGVVRVRKHWRRPGLLLRAHAWAPPSLGAAAPTRYLETHVWHAKRAHMEEAWGHKLAACNNALGVRALHRAMSRHCCAHDRSYMQLVEIFGSEQLIVDTLAHCGADRRLILAKDARSGARRVRILLRDCGDQLITPALLLWSPSMTTRHPPMAKEPSDEEMPFTIDVQGTGPSPGSGGDVDMVEAALEATPETGWIVWLWVHPAAAQEAVTALGLAAVQARSSREGALWVSPTCGPSYLELTGPKTLEVLRRALPPEACRSSPAARIWSELEVASVAPPCGAVLALEVQAAFLASGKDGQPGSSRLGSRKDWLARWPPEAAQGGLWADSSHTPSEDGHVAVMLVFRHGGKMADCAAGVDILFPPGAVQRNRLGSARVREKPRERQSKQPAEDLARLKLTNSTNVLDPPLQALLDMPLDEVWAMANSPSGLKDLGSRLCSYLGKRSTPSLLEGVNLGAGNVSDMVDASCGFPCALRDGQLQVSSQLGVKERLWLGYMVVHLRRGSMGKENVVCGQQGPRYLQHVSGRRGQGLGNMLQGLQATMALALVTGRAVLMKWPRLEDAVQPRFFDWQMAIHSSCQRSVKTMEGWNFGRTQRPVDILAAGFSSDPGFLQFTGNWGVGPFWRQNLTGVGLPTATLEGIFRNQAAMAAGCLLHFPLGSRPELQRQVFQILGGVKSHVAVQLRTGDSAKGSISGDSSDKRPVLRDKAWGLQSPEEAARQIAACATQLCAKLDLAKVPGSLTAGDTPCEVFFESDNIRAREVIRKLPTETGTRFRTSVMRPRHSSDESAIPETLAAMLALSSHKTLIWTTGAISAMVRQFGTLHLTGARDFQFELFLRARANRNQSMQNLLRCHFAGARAMGFRDRQRLLASRGLPEFPIDFPDAPAGNRQAEHEGAAALQRFQRKPPGKRPNFAVSGARGKALVREAQAVLFVSSRRTCNSRELRGRTFQRPRRASAGDAALDGRRHSARHGKLPEILEGYEGKAPILWCQARPGKKHPFRCLPHGSRS